MGRRPRPREGDGGAAATPHDDAGRGAVLLQSDSAEQDQAELALTELQDDLDSLAQALEDDVQAIETKHEALRDETEERTVGLEKNDIQVERLGILWIPVHRRV